MTYWRYVAVASEVRACAGLRRGAAARDTSEDGEMAVRRIALLLTWVGSSLFDDERRHHARAQVLGDVTMDHPSSGIRHVDEQLDRLARRE